MKKRMIAILVAVLLMTMVLSGGGGTGQSDANNGYSSKSAIAENGSSFRGDSGLEENGTEPEQKTEVKKNARKLIKNISLSIDTKTYDSLISTIDAEVEKYEGYIQESSTNQYYDRSTTIVVRIPCEKTDAFLKAISSKGTIVYKDVSTEDVTLTYADTEAHLKALRQEQAKLMEFMENAKTISDLISIQDRITSVQYEIETYESQLRTFDNLIDYDTIRLTINEVEVEHATEDVSVWSEIANNYSEAFYQIGTFFRNLFVYVVSAIPYILVFLFFVFIIILVIVIIPKNSKKRKMKKQAKKQENNQIENQDS